MTHVEQTCWTLIHDAAGGDSQARAEFASHYLDVVRAYLGARWTNTTWQSHQEDAVQDVFLECFRTDGALSRVQREGGNFRTFLYAVTRNVALRHEDRARRSREAGPPSAMDLTEVESDDAQLSRVYDREWAMALLRRAQGRHRDRAERDGEAGRRRLELLRRRFEDGLPIREIASEWNLPAEQLHAEYRKARDEFKRALREEVSFHQPDSKASVDRECVRLLSLLQAS